MSSWSTEQILTLRPYAQVDEGVAEEMVLPEE
jgi:hypothetical protein